LATRLLRMVGVQTRLLLATLYFFVPAYLANMAPVFVQGHFASLARPIDAGRTFRGRRVLGDHKTWRGLIAGTAMAVVVFAAQVKAYQAGWFRSLALIDYAQAGALPGFLLGLGTGVGDAVKSFFKRQLGIAPGSSWIGFDQLDFLAGAWLFVAPVYAPPLLATIAVAPIVFLGSIATTVIGYWIGVKEAWI
jgi:CDP-2,3-bis-(O-geranylgeranyl)-sn-glycerol synthase